METSNEFSRIKEEILGSSFLAIGFGCWSTVNINDEMVNEYLEHHSNTSSNDTSNFIIED